MLVSGYMIDMNGWIGFCTVFIIVIELENNGIDGKLCTFISPQSERSELGAFYLCPAVLSGVCVCESGYCN